MIIVFRTKNVSPPPISLVLLLPNYTRLRLPCVRPCFPLSFSSKPKSKGRYLPGNLNRNSLFFPRLKFFFCSSVLRFHSVIFFLLFLILSFSFFLRPIFELFSLFIAFRLFFCSCENDWICQLVRSDFLGLCYDHLSRSLIKLNSYVSEWRLF